MQNELAGLQFYCRDFEFTRVNGQITCARTSGDDVLKLMELKDLSIGGNIAALFGLWMGFLLLSYVALRKTSSSPSGYSRFPKIEHFVPSAAAANTAALPVMAILQPASLSHEVPNSHPIDLPPPNLFHNLCLPGQGTDQRVS